MTISDNNKKDLFSTNVALLISTVRFLHDSTKSSSGVWIIYFHALFGLLFSLILTLNFLNLIGLEIIKHPHILASFLRSRPL